MKLFEVTITHRDSCKTYPLRRLGLDHLIDWSKDTPTIHDLITSSNFERVNEPEAGSILIWIENDYLHTDFQPHHIDESGFIFWIKRYNYGHCAVYEGNNMISECWVEHCKSQLRLRKYDEIKKPNFHSITIGIYC